MDNKPSVDLPAVFEVSRSFDPDVQIQIAGMVGPALTEGLSRFKTRRPLESYLQGVLKAAGFLTNVQVKVSLTKGLRVIVRTPGHRRFKL